MVLWHFRRDPAVSKRKTGRAQRKPAVLIFGENHNDTSSIRNLIQHLDPNLAAEADILPRRDPPSLTRHAKLDTTRSWLTKISDVVAAESRIRMVRAVLVHQDSDGPDAQEAVARKLDKELKRTINSSPAYAVVPIQMTEGWWLMFPDAVRASRPSAWKDLKLPNRDTGGISNPKKVLQTATRKASPKNEYSESDSLAISEIIRDTKAQPSHTNSSWDSFVKRVSIL